MRIERNIRKRNNQFRVSVMRRPHEYYGGLHNTIEDARTARDKIEAEHPAGKAGSAPSTDMRSLSQRRRDLQATRRAAGLCTLCGDTEPKQGRKTCEGCLSEISNHRRVIQTQRLLQGLCGSCGKNPPTDERISCRTCLDKRNKAA